MMPCIIKDPIFQEAFSANYSFHLVIKESDNVIRSRTYKEKELAAVAGYLVAKIFEDNIQIREFPESSKERAGKQNPKVIGELSAKQYTRTFFFLSLFYLSAFFMPSRQLIVFFSELSSLSLSFVPV